MHVQYKILLTGVENTLDCEAEFIVVKTSLAPANEAEFAQAMTSTLDRLYSEQGRELLCVWEVDSEGNESKFYQ